MAGRNHQLTIAKRAAEVLRETGGVNRYRERGYTRVDPFEIADGAGLTVMLRPLKDLLGAFVRDEQSGILVNADRPPGLVHMTCAHELGHYFLGHETTTDRKLDYGPDAMPIEHDADWFAYQLLMPRSLLADLIRRKGWSNSLSNPFTLYQLSLRLGTSYTATLWTLMRLNILNISIAGAKTLARIQPQTLKRQLVGVSEDTVTDVWLLDKSDKDLILEPRPADRFVLDLPSHVSAGYLWTLADASDAGFVMRPVTHVGPTDRKGGIDTLVVGGVVLQRYMLDSVGDVRARDHLERIDMNFNERQPWRVDQPPNDRFQTSAEFESIELGLSDLARKRLIAEVAAS